MLFVVDQRQEGFLISIEKIFAVLKNGQKSNPLPPQMEKGGNQVTNFLSIIQGLTGENFGSKMKGPR